MTDHKTQNKINQAEWESLDNWSSICFIKLLINIKFMKYRASPRIMKQMKAL